MSVKLIVRNKEHEVKPGMTVQRAVQKIGLQPDLYLAVRDGELLTEDEVLRDGDIVQLVAVISGGMAQP